ncbi:hypothetical protein ACQEXR_17400 [Vibrio sp. TRT 2004]
MQQVKKAQLKNDYHKANELLEKSSVSFHQWVVDVFLQAKNVWIWLTRSDRLHDLRQ